MIEEKQPELIRKSFIYRGIIIESRYGRFEEIQTAQKIVDVALFLDIEKITKIFCDTKAVSCWTISLDGVGADPNKVKPLANLVRAVLFVMDKGFNEINFTSSKQTYCCDADWLEDY